MIFIGNLLRFNSKTNIYTKTQKFSTKLATQVYVSLRNKSKSWDIILQANHKVDELKCKITKCCTFLALKLLSLPKGYFSMEKLFSTEAVVGWEFWSKLWAAGEISYLSVLIILEMSMFCILFLMYRLMLQVWSLKSSSWIACSASLMVCLALSIDSISLIRHSYWSLILGSWLAKPVVCKLTFAWVTKTPDPSKLSTIAFTSGKFFA